MTATAVSSSMTTNSELRESPAVELSSAAGVTLSTSSTAFVIGPKGKELSIRVHYGPFLPEESYPSIQIPVARILAQRASGRVLKDDWFAQEIVPRLWRLIDSSFQEWSIMTSFREILEEVYPGSFDPEKHTLAKEWLAFSPRGHVARRFGVGELKAWITDFIASPDKMEIYLDAHITGFVGGQVNLAMQGSSYVTFVRNTTCLDRSLSSLNRETEDVINQEHQAHRRALFSDDSAWQAPPTNAPVSVLKTDRNVVASPLTAASNNSAAEFDELRRGSNVSRDSRGSPRDAPAGQNGPTVTDESVAAETKFLNPHGTSTRWDELASQTASSVKNSYQGLKGLWTRATYVAPGRAPEPVPARRNDRHDLDDTRTSATSHGNGDQYDDADETGQDNDVSASTSRFGGPGRVSFAPGVRTNARGPGTPLLRRRRSNSSRGTPSTRASSGGDDGDRYDGGGDDGGDDDDDIGGHGPPSDYAFLLPRRRPNDSRGGPSTRASSGSGGGDRYNRGGGDGGSGGGDGGGGGDDTGGDGPPHDNDGYDPNWDSFVGRNNFDIGPSRERIVDQRQGITVLCGPDWRQHQTSFKASVMEGTMTNPSTGRIFPWIADRPSYGTVVNHPVAIDILYHDREMFLSCFRHSGSRPSQPQLQTKKFALFERRFPSRGEGEHLLHFLNRVVEHGATHGCYVPPVHTLSVNEELGAWYSKLEHWTQHECDVSVRSTLLTCLRSKYTNLVSDPIIKSLIGTQVNGYTAFYELAVHAGHPGLDQYAQTPDKPKQRGHETLSTHIKNWLHFAQMQGLHGIHLSDRFFAEQVIRSAHPRIRDIVYPEVVAEMNRPSQQRPTYNFPLDESFAPDRYSAKLTRIAHGKGLAATFVKPPRDFQTHPVRELGFENEELCMRAVTQMLKRICWRCGDPGHISPDCTLSEDDARKKLEANGGGRRRNDDRRGDDRRGARRNSDRRGDRRASDGVRRGTQRDRDRPMRQIDATDEEDREEEAYTDDGSVETGEGAFSDDDSLDDQVTSTDFRLARQS